MAEDQSWRSRLYGNLSGGQLEDALANCAGVWERRTTILPPSSGEEALAGINRLIAVQNWTPLYDVTLEKLIDAAVKVMEAEEAMQQAASAGDPYSAARDVIANIPVDAPDHPAALPVAFALTANLEAVARYSRTINDMLVATQSGEIDALLDALSIDSAIIGLPVCRAMLKYGQLTGDVSYAKEFFSKIKGPHKGRLRYPKLRWAEYLLWESGALDGCRQDEIHELVVVHLAHLRLFGDDEEHANSKANLFKDFRDWRNEREGRGKRKGRQRSAT